MLRRDKPIRTAVWLLASVFACALSCAGTVGDDPEPPPVEEPAAMFPDQEMVGGEEVLYDYEEDEWGRPVEKKTAQGTAGEFLVAVGYVSMIVASFVLPLLAL